MKKFNNFILILSFVFSYTLVFADDKDTFDDSMNKTQELLRDRKQREKAVSETKDAQKAHGQVQKLAPDAKTEDEYYQLASEIMNNYREEKDEDAMKKSVTEGQRNPADFYNNLTPAQKEKIKTLGEKLNPGVQTRP